MKLTFCNKILLFLASLEDFRQASFSINSASLYLAGHPALHKERIFMEQAIANKRKKRRLQKILTKLKQRGILQTLKKRNTVGYFITKKGQRDVLLLRAKNKRKDKLPQSNLLMVFFDIPEKMRLERDYLRAFLRELGYNMLQKSIWVSNYDTSKEVKIFLNEHGLNRYVQPLIVKKILSLKKQRSW